MAAKARRPGGPARRPVQYRVVFGKSDEAVGGPDDASAVIRVAARDAAADPWVSYMRGSLKVEGSSGALFDALASGEAGEALRALASRP